MPESTPLEIPTARGTVSVASTLGIFHRVLVDDAVAKPARGGWGIPLRDGSVGLLRQRGLVPGFQKLFLDGTQVHDFGAGVTKPQKIAAASPLVFVAFGLIGVVPLLLVLMLNISLVKNPVMPRQLKVIMPIMNTVAVVAMLWLLIYGKSAS